MEIVLAVNHFSGIEYMVAEAGNNLEKVMIRIDVLIKVLIVYDPLLLLFS